MARRLVTTFVTASVEPGSTVVTDGFASYDTLPGLGYRHRPVIVDKDYDQVEEFMRKHRQEDESGNRRQLKRVRIGDPTRHLNGVMKESASAQCPVDFSTVDTIIRFFAQILRRANR